MYIPTPDELNSAIEQNKQSFTSPTDPGPDVDSLMKVIQSSSVHGRNHYLMTVFDGATGENLVAILDSIFAAGYATRDRLTHVGQTSNAN